MKDKLMQKSWKGIKRKRKCCNVQSLDCKILVAITEQLVGDLVYVKYLNLPTTLPLRWSDRPIAWDNEVTSSFFSQELG